jgi:hypothetical protein
LVEHQIHVATAAQAQSRERVPVHARIATTVNTKMKQAKPHALTVRLENFQQMWTKRNPHALIAVLDISRPLQHRIPAPTSVSPRNIR